MKRHCFFVLCLLFVLAVAESAVGRGAKTGGWSPIKDLKDKHVVEIGNFAVSEYNKQSKTNLVLQTIVTGEQQVVAGTNYRLVLAVKGGDSSEYEAVVWEKPWEKFTKLTSFKPVKG